MNLKNILILVDLDNVIVNYELGIIEGLKKSFPKAPYIEIKNRNTWNIYEQYRREFGSVKELATVNQEENFYTYLKPMDGAINALNEMDKLFDVKICGQIPANNSMKKKYTKEKKTWIKTHLGNKWIKKTILTPKNKSEIGGHYLIDDCPKHDDGNNGWELILFEWPYNNKNSNYIHINWSNWKEVLLSKIRSDLKNEKFKF